MLSSLDPGLHYESVTHALYHCTVRCMYTLTTEHRGRLGIKKCITGCWVQLASIHRIVPLSAHQPAAPVFTSRHHGGLGAWILDESAIDMGACSSKLGILGKGICLSFAFFLYGLRVVATSTMLFKGLVRIILRVI